MRRSILASNRRDLRVRRPGTQRCGERGAHMPEQSTVVVSGQGHVHTARVQCRDDDEETGGGLLGNAPIVGNLPGLSGIL